jgi:hypothetical protein
MTHDMRTYNFKQPRQHIEAAIASASEAIHGARMKEWIASSLTLPCANASRLSQAMTEVIEIRVRDLAAQPREFCFELSAI